MFCLLQLPVSAESWRVLLGGELLLLPVSQAISLCSYLLNATVTRCEKEFVKDPQRADAAGWSDLRYVGIFALYLGSSLLLAALGFATFIHALGAGYWGWLLLPGAAVGVVLWRKQAAAAAEAEAEAEAEAAAAAAAKLGLRTGMGMGSLTTPDDDPTPPTPTPTPTSTTTAMSTTPAPTPTPTPARRLADALASALASISARELADVAHDAYEVLFPDRGRPKATQRRDFAVSTAVCVGLGLLGLSPLMPHPHSDATYVSIVSVLLVAAAVAKGASFALLHVCSEMLSSPPLCFGSGDVGRKVELAKGAPPGTLAVGGGDGMAGGETRHVRWRGRRPKRFAGVIAQVEELAGGVVTLENGFEFENPEVMAAVAAAGLGMPQESAAATPRTAARQLLARKSWMPRRSLEPGQPFGCGGGGGSPFDSPAAAAAAGNKLEIAPRGGGKPPLFEPRASWSGRGMRPGASSGSSSSCGGYGRVESESESESEAEAEEVSGPSAVVTRQRPAVSVVAEGDEEGTFSRNVSFAATSTSRRVSFAATSAPCSCVIGAVSAPAAAAPSVAASSAAAPSVAAPAAAAPAAAAPASGEVAEAAALVEGMRANLRAEEEALQTRREARAVARARREQEAARVAGIVAGLTPAGGAGAEEAATAGGERGRTTTMDADRLLAQTDGGSKDKPERRTPGPSVGPPPPVLPPAPSSTPPPRRPPVSPPAPAAPVAPAPAEQPVAPAPAAPVDFASPPTDFATPPMDFASPFADFAAPPADFAAPPVDFAAAPVDFGSPPVDFAAPPTPLAPPPPPPAAAAAQAATPPVIPALRLAAMDSHSQMDSQLAAMEAQLKEMEAGGGAPSPMPLQATAGAGAAGAAAASSSAASSSMETPRWLNEAAEQVPTQAAVATSSMETPRWLSEAAQDVGLPQGGGRSASSSSGGGDDASTSLSPRRASSLSRGQKVSDSI